ncbi:MAG: phage/plasmid primase, P4 family [Tepidisphaeraceae bacterium]|jgi:putative DNA primase/helicase
MSTTDFPKLAGAFAENAYPAMVDDLAKPLGVSADALYALGLGFAPKVIFKKGSNYQGWWAFPSRDEDGKIIGLALRKDAVKVSYSDSKVGLFYAVNPNHKAGQESYQPGRQNWIRTMEAGVPCPICGKPDGCLLSAENPVDPKAVICRKVESNLPRQIGYLHIRKEEGNVGRDLSPLPPSDFPVVVVEGYTDVAAAHDLGLVAVGRPSNLAGLQMLGKLLRGRDVWILGENDRKADGDWPGKKGMEAAFATLMLSAKSVRMALPPEQFKDLREWKIKDAALTRETLKTWMMEQGKDFVDDVIFEPSDPLPIARAIKRIHFETPDGATLFHINGQFFGWDASKYSPLSDDRLRALAFEFLDQKQRWTRGREPHLVRFAPNAASVSNVIDAIKAVCHSSAAMPSWINDNGSLPKALEVLPMKNRLLHLSVGRPPIVLSKPTPNYLSVNAVDYDFQPDAANPIEWLKFLNSIWTDDAESVSTLQEWMGYCLTLDTRFQKILFLIGPKRSGKGSIARILRAMIGETNTAAPTLSSLAQNFGLEPLIGKQLSVIGDARLGTRTDSSTVTERLLSISGEDALTIDRKFREPLTLRLPTRLMFLSNELPRLSDASGALASRFIVLRMTNSFYGREDIGLETRLRKELPGILNWALVGWNRLYARGHFIQPSSGSAAVADLEALASPISVFAEDRCILGPDKQIRVKDLYESWRVWCVEQGRDHSAGSVQMFARDLFASFPNIRSIQKRTGDERVKWFDGISLTREGWSGVMARDGTRA